MEIELYGFTADDTTAPGTPSALHEDGIDENARRELHSIYLGQASVWMRRRSDALDAGMHATARECAYHASAAIEGVLAHMWPRGHK